MALRSVAPCLAGLALHGACVASQRDAIFLIDDQSGAIRLSDRDWEPSARLLLEHTADTAPLLPANPTRRSGGTRRADSPAQDGQLIEIVRQAASAQGIAPELLHAMIATESGYAARAVSPRGAQGLMQLMPATAQSYGVTDPFDARQNIHAGARHLRRLLDQFGQDTALALAAYNAGAATVVRHRYSIPPFAETVAYVPRVLQRFAQLRGAAAAHLSTTSP
ncbi:MAG TPA: lytic transglycosylase domain-containing protein [Rhizobacter sp.]|nr:lytic transglycosylase domain-containing protein [Rhizobacter sp.]